MPKRPTLRDIAKQADVAVTDLGQGVTRKILAADGKLMAVEVYFEQGAVGAPHSHPHEQTSYVAKGEILFFCDGEPEQHLKEGDMFAAPSGKEHTIQLLSKEVRLVDSFYPLRADFLE